MTLHLLPTETVVRELAGASPALTVKWAERGGQAYFPRDLDLQQEGQIGPGKPGDQLA